MKTKSTLRSGGLMQQLRTNWQMYVLLLPFMFFFFLFTVWPVIASIFVSFTEYNVLEAPRFVGLDNYRRLFLEDDIFKKAIGNTLVFAIVTGPLGYLISFFTSWIINEFGRFTKALLTFIFYIPSISGTVYTIWGLIFDSDIYGYANSFLIRLGIIDDPINWLTNESYILPLIILVQLWMSMGVGFLAMRAGFATTDSQYYEAGAIDGIRNRWQEHQLCRPPADEPFQRLQRHPAGARLCQRDRGVFVRVHLPHQPPDHEKAEKGGCMIWQGRTMCRTSACAAGSSPTARTASAARAPATSSCSCSWGCWRCSAPSR